MKKEFVDLKQDKKSSSIDSTIKLIVAICLLSALAVSAGVYYSFNKRQEDELRKKVYNLQNELSTLQKQISDLRRRCNLESTKTDNLSEGQRLPIEETSNKINWISPTEIASLKIFEKDYREKAAKYYKVGEFKDKDNKEKEIILVSAPVEAPSFYPDFYRFVRERETGKMTLLEKYSSGLYKNDGLDRRKFEIDKTYTIPELDFPEYLEGPKPRQILRIDKGINEFFSQKGLKKVFTDKKWGDVYTTDDSSPAFKDIKDSTFSRYGFYIEAPDGTVKVYYLKVDFVGENGVPEITWNDGTKNTARYSFTKMNGCGSENYIYVVSGGDIDITRDLKPAGKNSKEDVIYELKDVNHQLLKNIYNNEYWVPKGKRKMPYEKFVKERPVFFWVDPFGRLIRFENNNFVPLSECAKPVIYLYPKSTSDISVKIYPKGGITYSSPPYNNGWTVIADKNGNLIDLASGKKYPYLFWEGRGGIYKQPGRGFVVAQKDVHQFLVEKLRKLGLNKKETSDFIKFWEPKMKNAPYYFITFLGNREMEQIAPLEIEPKPDTIIRVLMDFSPLEKPINVKGFEIKTPKRSGFTVIEWGGVLRK